MAKPIRTSGGGAAKKISEELSRDRSSTIGAIVAQPNVAGETTSRDLMKKYHFLLILWLGGLALAGQKPAFFEPIQPRPLRTFQVMAHRGAAGQAPENTSAALKRAIEDGFEWAEIDLQLTRDGVHVLYHDDRL